MAPGGVALVLHPTHRLGFSGQKGVSKYSGGAVCVQAMLGKRRGLCSQLCWGGDVEEQRF